MKKNNVKVFVRSLVFIALSLLCNEAVLAETTVGNTIEETVGKIWEWIRLILLLGFVITFIFGSISVYSKTHSEEPKAFMSAAKNWLIGLGFILLFLGILSTIVSMFTTSTSSDIIKY